MICMFMIRTYRDAWWIRLYVLLVCEIRPEHCMRVHSSLCTYSIWTDIEQYLVGGLEHFLFFHILGRIIPTDELIFFRGVGIPPTRYCITPCLQETCIIYFWDDMRTVWYGICFHPWGPCQKTTKDVGHSTSFHIIPLYWGSWMFLGIL